MLGLLGTLSYSITYSEKVHPVVKKLCNHKISQHSQDEFTVNISMLIQLYTFFQALIVNKKVYNWRSYDDIVRYTFRTNIFNFSIRFIWLNLTYIIPAFCQTTL